MGLASEIVGFLGLMLKELFFGLCQIIVEPDSKASITKYGNVRTEIHGKTGPAVDTKADVVQLSIFNNRFMGIAEQMGRTLQRTSISTNIKVL